MIGQQVAGIEVKVGNPQVEIKAEPALVQRSIRYIDIAEAKIHACQVIAIKQIKAKVDEITVTARPLRSRKG